MANVGIKNTPEYTYCKTRMAFNLLNGLTDFGLRRSVILKTFRQKCYLCRSTRPEMHYASEEPIFSSLKRVQVIDDDYYNNKKVWFWESLS